MAVTQIKVSDLSTKVDAMENSIAQILALLSSSVASPLVTKPTVSLSAETLSCATIEKQRKAPLAPDAQEQQKQKLRERIGGVPSDLNEKSPYSLPIGINRHRLGEVMSTVTTIAKDRQGNTLHTTETAADGSSVVIASKLKEKVRYTQNEQAYVARFANSAPLANLSVAMLTGEALEFLRRNGMASSIYSDTNVEVHSTNGGASGSKFNMSLKFKLPVTQPLVSVCAETNLPVEFFASQSMETYCQLTANIGYQPAAR